VISCFRYTGVSRSDNSAVRSRRMLMAAPKTRLHSSQQLFTYFMRRRKLRSTLHSQYVPSLCASSVRSSQQKHLSETRCSHTSTTTIPLPRADLLRVIDCVNARYTPPLTRIKVSAGCLGPYPHPVPYRPITGFFWAISSASTRCAARACAHCSIRQRIHGTRCCP
jgi:hypothetical protein